MLYRHVASRGRSGTKSTTARTAGNQGRPREQSQTPDEGVASVRLVGSTAVRLQKVASRTHVRQEGAVARRAAARVAMMSRGCGPLGAAGGLARNRLSSPATRCGSRMWRRRSGLSNGWWMCKKARPLVGPGCLVASVMQATADSECYTLSPSRAVGKAALTLLIARRSTGTYLGDEGGTVASTENLAAYQRSRLARPMSAEGSP